MTCQVWYNGYPCERDAKWNLKTRQEPSTDICATHKNTFVRKAERFNEEDMLGIYFQLDYTITPL